MGKKILPCKTPCPMCGSKDVYYQFYSKHPNPEKEIARIKSLNGVINRSNEFVVFFNDYAIYKKDTIHCNCKCCSYSWEIEPLKRETNERNRKM
jgi:hypothetical protein